MLYGTSIYFTKDVNGADVIEYDFDHFPNWLQCPIKLASLVHTV
jgi:hypothetical protein